MRVRRPAAAPDVIHWAPGLPKTRSGKIMRRVLRKIACSEESQLVRGRLLRKIACNEESQLVRGRVRAHPRSTGIMGTHVMGWLLSCPDVKASKSGCVAPPPSSLSPPQGDISTLADPSVVAMLVALRGQ